jgi:hypothetical protein
MRKSEPRLVHSVVEVAEQLGISLLAVKVLGAAGCPGLEQFAPSAANQADVARYFDVRRSTVSDWAYRGMPTEPDGTYNLVKVRQWRLSQPNPPESMTKGNSSIANQQATAEIVRALFRVLRVEIAIASQAIVDGFIEQCFPDADQGEADRIGDSLVSLLVDKLKPLCLTECDVEHLISDCARLV